AEQAIQQAKIEEYVEYVKQQAEEEAKLAEIEEELAAAAERVAEANAAAAGTRTITGGVDPRAMAELNAAVDAQNTLSERQRELQAALDETTAHIEGIKSAWEAAGGAAEDASAQTVTYEQAAATAFQSVQAEIEELCEAYDEAYAAAKESFEGQFGLFDEASTKSDEYVNATVENAQKALDSQLQYWDTYLANIEVLKGKSADELHITQENYEALMAYVQDGSEEAAGLAQSMVNQINAGNEEAVAKLANTVGEVQAKQAEASASIADWQTNFNATMDELEQRMNEAVTNMNMSGEAEASAQATINSYAQAIRNGQGEATAAAKAIADGVAATLAANPITVNVKVNQVPGTTLPAHAHGTTNAESAFIAGEEGPELIARKADAYAVGTTDSSDFYIAGERGPELIVGRQGSTVFPHEETERIIRELSGPEPGNSFQDSRTYSTAYYYGDENHYASYNETESAPDERVFRSVLSFFDRLLTEIGQLLSSVEELPTETEGNSVENVFNNDALQTFLSNTIEEAGDNITTTYERNYDTDYSYGTDSHAVTNPDDHSVTFQNNFGADTVLTSLLNRLIGERFGTRTAPVETAHSTRSPLGPASVFQADHSVQTFYETLNQYDTALERVQERMEAIRFFNTDRSREAADRSLETLDRSWCNAGQSREAIDRSWWKTDRFANHEERLLCSAAEEPAGEVLPPSVYVSMDGAAVGTASVSRVPVTAGTVHQDAWAEEPWSGDAGVPFFPVPNDGTSTTPVFVPQETRDAETFPTDSRESRILDYEDQAGPESGPAAERQRPAPPPSETQRGTQTGEPVKRILLELAGKGAIDIGRSSKEEVVSVMQAYMKPFLMNLLRSEVYEEGNKSYDF
ncbi:MAG: hypothetical protein IJT94_11175, partial [Oscillibacter sp.]|nr:hypothetical protein [Oscillibacter sp.]